ncbi:MAG TPA: YoaK family protein [Jatrophihabitantaceae bacterium]
MDPHQNRRHEQARTAGAVALAMVSGATDALGFLALGGVFTSVMTGNMVLLGTSVGRLDRDLAVHSVAAIVCFVLGCVAGARIAGAAEPNDPVWPAAITRAIWVETAAMVVVAITWWSSGSHPGENIQILILVLNAFALGVQSSAVLRFGVSGLSTTYLTGTLTTLVTRLAHRHRFRDMLPSAIILAGLISGAAIMSVVLRFAPTVAPALQLSGIAVALLLGTFTQRSWRPGTP